MNRRSNLVLDKLPKRRRRKTNDKDDELLILGMCNNNLNTEGYDVDATDNGYRQIFQKLKGLNCYMIVQLKTIRENERTQEAQ